MSEADRARIADLLEDVVAPTINALPELSAAAGARQMLVAAEASIANSGVSRLLRVAAFLRENQHAARLDDMLHDYDLVGEVLDAKDLLLRELYGRWRNARDLAREVASSARRGLSRALRVATESLLLGLNAFLGSLINAFTAAALPVGGLDAAKEAKEYCEAVFSSARR